MVGYPYTSILGAILVAAIIVTTWWVPGMRSTIYAGLPWLALLTSFISRGAVPVLRRALPLRVEVPEA